MAQRLRFKSSNTLSIVLAVMSRGEGATGASKAELVPLPSTLVSTLVQVSSGVRYGKDEITQTITSQNVNTS